MMKKIWSHCDTTKAWPLLLTKLESPTTNKSEEKARLLFKFSVLQVHIRSNRFLRRTTSQNPKVIQFFRVSFSLFKVLGCRKKVPRH